MQSVEHLGRYKSSADCLRQVLATEGPGALFSGFAATCVRNAPFNALYFSIIFSAKSSLPERRTFATDLALGCVAGGVSTFAIAPFDVIKSRMQNQRSNAGELEYRNTGHALVKIIRNEGVGALYKGFGPLLLKVVLSCGVSYSAFSFALDNLTGAGEDDTV